VCRPHAPGELAAAFLGRRLTSAHRRGKFLWVETDDGDGPVLGLHLGMAGRIVIDEEPAPRRWDRFTLEFEGGGRLALRDKRRLGRAVLEPDYSHVGPDAGEIGAGGFAKRVGRGTVAIKARLLDQGVVAGIGNLLADEVLWRAKLSPLRPAGDLQPAASTDTCARQSRTPSAWEESTRGTSSRIAPARARAPAAGRRSSGPPSAAEPRSGAPRSKTNPHLEP